MRSVKSKLLLSFRGAHCVLVEIAKRSKTKPSLPSRLVYNVVELLLIGGGNSVGVELRHHYRQTEKILLRADRCQWIIADGRL